MGNKLGRRAILKGGLGLGLAGAGITSGLVRPSVVQAAGRPKINLLVTEGANSRLENVLFRELGLFEKYGVDANVQFVSDGSKMLAGIIGGSADMCGGSGFSGLFPAIQQGAKIKVLAGADTASLTVLYASNKHPEIKSVADLPGHSMGAGSVGALLYILVVGVMNKYHADYKQVHFANVGNADSIWQALVGGTIEVGAGPLQFRDSAGKYGLHLVAGGEFYKELPLFLSQAMYASDAAIAEKREGLVGMMAAYADLFRWMEKPENKGDYIRFYKQATGSATSDEEASFLFDFLSQPGRLSRDLVLSKEQVAYVQQLNVEVGVQKTEVPFEQAVDVSMAKEATKLVESKI